MKCLPAAKVPGTSGNVLHDWHAETLAIRALNNHLLHECRRLVSSPESKSSILRVVTEADKHNMKIKQPFAIREDVKIHMYSSKSPCGDASMELVMSAQDDPTPWPILEELPDKGA